MIVKNVGSYYTIDTPNPRSSLIQVYSLLTQLWTQYTKLSYHLGINLDKMIKYMWVEELCPSSAHKP